MTAQIPPKSPATSTAPPRTQPPAHRIGVCSWSLKPASPDELVAALNRLGVDAVQLALSPIVHDPANWHDAIARVRDRGIDVLSGVLATRGEDYSTLASIAATGGVRLDERWDENLEHAQRVADIAAAGRIGLITFHAGFIPHDANDPVRNVMLERLRAIADLFTDRGIATAFETGQETATTLLDALDALQRPSVGVNFDPANMILYGMGDPVQALTLLAPRVKQIHIKDALPTQTPGTWGSEVVAGTGAVDWPRFFEIANAINPPVNYVIEREGGDSREADIAIALRLIRRFA